MSPVAQVESSTTNISPILNLILSADHRGNPYDNNDLVWIGLDVFQEFTSLTITLIDNGTDVKYRVMRSSSSSSSSLAQENSLLRNFSNFECHPVCFHIRGYASIQSKLAARKHVARLYVGVRGRKEVCQKRYDHILCLFM